MFVCVCVYVCMYVCTMQVMAQSLRVLHYLCTAVPDPAVAAAVAAGAVGKCVEFSRKNDAEAQPLSRELRVASVDVLCLLGRYEAALAHMAEPMSRVVESLADGETEVQLAAVQGLQALLSTDAIDGEVGAGGGSGPGIGPFAMQKPGEGNAELAGDAGRVGNAAREGGAGSGPDGRDKVGGELGGGGGGGAGAQGGEGRAGELAAVCEGSPTAKALRESLDESMQQREAAALLERRQVRELLVGLFVDADATPPVAEQHATVADERTGRLRQMYLGAPAGHDVKLHGRTIHGSQRSGMGGLEVLMEALLMTEEGVLRHALLGLLALVADHQSVRRRLSRCEGKAVIFCLTQVP